MKAKKKSSALRILLLVFVLVCLVPILFFMVIDYMEKNHPSEIFPFDDKEGKYRIHTSPEENYVKYWLSYRGYKEPTSRGKYTHVSVIVGNSKFDLQPYVDKEVIVEGNWSISDKQCILTVCDDIGGAVVANIESIRLR